MAKAKADRFVNRAIQRVTMSAANTLTFQQVNFAAGIFQGVAVLLHRVIFHVGATAWRELVGLTDSFAVALTVSQQIADLNMTNAEVIIRRQFICTIVGAVVSMVQRQEEVEVDLSNLPGGGILIPANPIFVAMISANLTTPGVCDCEMLFTFKELADADYIELIQSRVQANI